MTALAILPGGRRAEGRPSNAALQMEALTLRHALATITEERDELADELAAYVAERIAAATQTVALARRGQVLLASGYRPSQPLHDLETLGNRELLRARSMRPQPEDAA